MFNEYNCSKCMACILRLSGKAPFMTQTQNVLTDFDKCTHCFKCVKNAISMRGTLSEKLYTVSIAFAEVMKDEVVFRTSGGEKPAERRRTDAA